MKNDNHRPLITVIGLIFAIPFFAVVFTMIAIFQVIMLVLS